MNNSVSKTGSNAVTVTVSDGDRNYTITLTKDNNTLAVGYNLITTKLHHFKDLPSGAVGVLQGSKFYPLGKISTDTTLAAISEYDNQSGIKLPRDRAQLVMDISCLFDKEEYLREQDYNDDMGFHKSAPVADEIKAAQLKLKEFDVANPKIVAEINKQKQIDNECKIHSALNA